MSRKRTVLIYGRSRSGKSSQVGELAEYVYKTTKKKSLVYSIDKGGVGPMSPYIDLGIIDMVEQGDANPFIFMNKACSGQVRDSSGKWIKADLSQYGMVANESLTSYADAMMGDLAEKSAQGLNVGGQSNVSFVVTSEGDSLKIGGSNMAHYNVVQTRILDEVWRSQKLPVDYIVWTASASKEDDQNAGGKVIGPEVVGKRLTAELPRHFDLTFRIDCLPAQSGKPERHILYLGNSVDLASGNAVGLGNTRLPISAKELPPTIEPASLVKALELINQGELEAFEAIKKRLALNGATPKVS